MGGARLSEHGWGGLSDFYEPYPLPKEMSGKPAGVQNPDIFQPNSKYEKMPSSKMLGPAVNRHPGLCRELVEQSNAPKNAACYMAAAATYLRT